MKLKDIEPNIIYTVTKNGSTLAKGETIWIEKPKGRLYSKQGRGWLEYDEWKYLRNEVTINMNYYIDNYHKAKEQVEIAKSLMMAMTLKKEE